jgi:hypothetical protein
VTSTQTVPPPVITATVTVSSGSPDLLLYRSQHGSVIPARVPRAEHRAHERADDPHPLWPSGNRHAFPNRGSGHRTPPLSDRPHSQKDLRSACGHTGMHARLRHARQAGARRTTARPWPSVKQPTVRTDRDGPRIPSAIRPWTPRHSGPQRYKVTQHGTKKKHPASARIRSQRGVTACLGWRRPGGCAVAASWPLLLWLRGGQGASDDS